MEEKKSEIEELLEKSKSTDVSVLLSAKEKSKRLAMDEPTATNLSAYKQASQMLEAIVENQKNLKDYKEVLEYAKEQGRKLAKTKFYEDKNANKIKVQADGSFKIRDVDKYIRSLPSLGTSDALFEKAADRQKQKEEAEIRRIRAIADKEEFDLARKKGEFVPRDKVQMELASRAIMLSSGIKTAFEVHSIDFVDVVEGNPKKGTQLIEKLEAIFDEAMNEYSQPVEFELSFEFEDRENRQDATENSKNVEDREESVTNESKTT